MTLSSTPILKMRMSELALLLIVLLSIHFTEFKIGVVKLSEIVLLLLPPIIYTRKLNKWIFYFYVLFFTWLVISLATNPFRELPELQGLSPLKEPYLITIGRFLELIACVNLVALVYYYMKGKPISYVTSFIKKIVFFSFFMIALNVIIYLLVINGVLSDSKVVNLTTSNYFRLKGGFVEGGPYGLMISFVFVLSFFYKSRFNPFIRIVLIATIILFTKSKAGMLLLVLWGVIYYYKWIYRKIKSLSVITFIIGGIVVLLSLSKLGAVYIEHIKNMEQYVLQRPDDTNLIMGRIAGSHIAPKMVVNNPLFGIGLGNYPIERNVAEYRKFIPYSPPGKTDAHGLGGIMQLLVDGGLFILFLFLIILFLLIRSSIRLKNNLEVYFAVFLCFFLAGVQIYFLYPWVLLGLLISLNEKQKLQA
ncbi:MAG: O-antigen ligase family protein [Eudoraea sp.]|nr:O-antigen ligase family protein [Eudoraea sp.]